MCNLTRIFITLVSIIILSACGLFADPANFIGDVEFLKKYTEVIVLNSEDSNGKVAVVAEYQARVMTSTATGDEGESFGWINYDLVKKQQYQPHMNAFGGEDRFWIGPEGGQFGFFFKQGDPFDLEHWQTPEPIDWGAWQQTSSSDIHVEFTSDFKLTNYSGTEFDINVRRRIALFNKALVKYNLGIEFDERVNYVAYETVNLIQNMGTWPWEKDSGLLSVWILGMYKPSADAVVVMPYKVGDVEQLGPIVNDKYFGEIASDRLKVDSKGIVYFRGDGQYRSKIGIPHKRAKDILGSYQQEKGILTIVKFTFDQDAEDYVNSMWEMQDDPYAGDVSNSYNDGPGADGKSLGPFFELESSSHALALETTEIHNHTNMTFHFQGDRQQLDNIAKITLGVGLDEIARAFSSN